MKSKYLTIVIVFLVTFFSCDESEFPSQDFSVDAITYGDCKPVTKAVLDEWLELTAANDYYLVINHINAYFNCYPGEIIVEATLKDGIITINEYETDNLANCICPYDLSFSIGPLKYETYTLLVKHSDYELLNVEIDFNKNIDLKIDIERTN